VIVGVNGKPVRRLADLTQELERVGVGKKVPLAVQRRRQRDLGRDRRDGHRPPGMSAAPAAGSLFASTLRPFPATD
jgi:hypothetical protein